ncbi:sphingomyelin phosphodiesterase [Streptacidiphilus jiangxiensis]|uniref:Metal-dependent hydrolase, endonuclease/exonuclease/phosphatase family n=1 Tax=Streptacidiphilus jiangxiensis TaxID=235985 RepID=A0A1H7LWA3_STRJI|nr:sphingomyelin phosphodiesterase [Streptacidiphilus jiangxiensis]SEL02765.1 Metal-dependent hydrolase, endonuclease/exonuclease/phosphatase family [Streptacidiphilus jiangxiensis]
MRKRALLAATVAVASAVLTGVTAAPAAHAATGNSLSVFAWNVDLGTSIVDSTENENAAGRTPVVEQIIQQHNADVVVLDELFNHSSTSSIESALAAQYPYHTPVVGQVCSGGGWNGISGDCSNSWFVINGGTMIFSKYPIKAQYAHVFSNSTSGTWDYNANKGAALAEIDKNGVNTWVVGTHLQADQSGTSTDTTQSTRLAQLGEIQGWVNGIVGSSAPVLIGGDLNVEYFHGASRGDYANAQNAVGGVLGTPATDPSQLTTMDCPVSAWCQYMGGVESFPTNYQDSLDYVGYLNAPGRPTPLALPSVVTDFDPQAGWTAGQLDTQSPSDHYPVQATFQLP